MKEIICELEKKRCLYCRKELNKEKFSSQWDPREHNCCHYKIIRCDCGKNNWVKVDFDGSGHDFSFQKELSPLESTIRKVRER
ncbi:hypothetical protein HZC32_01815 [Candidatus Woesearchaeota archaeon]|nr:hypothetical protein [Candidatus Woesearchaeota archaeon]